MEAAILLVSLNQQLLVKIENPTSFKGQPQTSIRLKIFTVIKLTPGPKMEDRRPRTVVP